MKNIPKAKKASRLSKYCRKCGTPIPEVIRIAKIKPDIDVVDLFKDIKKHFKETNGLLKQVSLLFKKVMLEARFMQ